jgi:charged multivesicular body protein 6
MGNFMNLILSQREDDTEEEENKSPKKPELTQIDISKLDLKNQKDKITVYSKKIEVLIDKNSKLAKQYLREKKPTQAKLALKNKKYYEKLIENSLNQIQNIEVMIDKIDEAGMDLKLMKALEQGTKSLTKIQNQMKIEEVEKIMADTKNAIEKQDEIDKILDQKLGEEGGYTDEELENDLKKYEQDEIKENEENKIKNIKIINHDNNDLVVEKKNEIDLEKIKVPVGEIKNNDLEQMEKIKNIKIPENEIVEKVEKVEKEKNEKVEIKIF